MSTPVPILQVDADPGIFPDDRPTTFTDGYGESQVLVPIEQLHEAQARLNELAADRNHWKSECEKARARWTSPWSRRERWVGETAEPIPFPRPYNDLHQIQVDYLRAIECSTSGPTPEERQEKYQQVFDAAMSMVYEVTHLRAQVANLQAELADERVVDAVVIDHTDPEQIHRAAGILEGIGMDAGVTRPELHMETATSLRERATLLEASQSTRESVVEQAARALFDATADKPEAYDHVRHHWIRYAQVLADAKLLAVES